MGTALSKSIKSMSVNKIEFRFRATRLGLSVCRVHTRVQRCFLFVLLSTLNYCQLFQNHCSFCSWFNLAGAISNQQSCFWTALKSSKLVKQNRNPQDKHFSSTSLPTSRNEFLKTFFCKPIHGQRDHPFLAFLLAINEHHNNAGTERAKSQKDIFATFLMNFVAF